MQSIYLDSGVYVGLGVASHIPPKSGTIVQPTYVVPLNSRYNVELTLGVLSIAAVIRTKPLGILLSGNHP